MNNKVKPPKTVRLTIIVIIYTVPFKSSWDNLQNLQNLCSHIIQVIPRNTTSFQQKTDAGYHTIWIEDPAQRVVGPDLRSILYVNGI